MLKTLKIHLKELSFVILLLNCFFFCYSVKAEIKDDVKKSNIIETKTVTNSKGTFQRRDIPQEEINEPLPPEIQKELQSRKNQINAENNSNSVAKKAIPMTVTNSKGTFQSRDIPQEEINEPLPPEIKKQIKH